MALYRNQGNQVTLGPGQTAFSNWSYEGLTDHGPQYVSANFIGADDNFGTVTTVQTSVISSCDDSLPYYWPMAISYVSQLRNDGTNAVLININIGTFE